MHNKNCVHLPIFAGLRIVHFFKALPTTLQHDAAVIAVASGGDLNFEFAFLAAVHIARFR